MKSQYQVLAAVAVVAMLSGAANAGSDASQRQDPLATDAQWIAKENALPYDQTLASLREQVEFTLALGEVLKTRSGDVVDHWWDGQEGHLVVHASALSVFEKLSDSWSADIALASADDSVPAFADRYLVELPAAQAAREAGAESASAAFKPESNTVEVTVYVSDGESSDQVEQLMTRVERSVASTASRRDPTLKYAVSYDYVATLPTTTANKTWGGFEYGGCTGGFIGEKGGGYGIILAAHCDNKPAKYGYETTAYTWIATGSRDLRYTATTGGTTDNWIRYTTGGTYREITSAAPLSVGQQICKYGKVTGYGCDSIYGYAGCFIYLDDGQYCGLFRSVHDMINSGDSGGPWFLGATAYGISSGEIPKSWSYLAAVFDVYSRFDGVSVRTN